MACELYLNKHKTFVLKALKDTVEKVKRQSTRCDKIFTKHTPDEEPVPRVHGEILQCNKKKTSNPVWHRIGIDISPKKIAKWPASVGNDVQRQ